MAAVVTTGVSLHDVDVAFLLRSRGSANLTLGNEIIENLAQQDEDQPF